MKTLLLSMTGLFISLSTFSQCKLDYSHYQLVMEDNFNYTDASQLSSSPFQWIKEYPDPYPHNIIHGEPEAK